VFAAFATSFRRLGPIVLEIAAAHSAAFSASLGGPLAVFGKVAGPAPVLRPVVHIEFLSRGVQARIDRAVGKPTSMLSLGFSLSSTVAVKNSRA
jgi:hypothetical protein